MEAACVTVDAAPAPGRLQVQCHMGAQPAPAGAPAPAGGACPPMRLIYLHFHNAIRAELDRASACVNELERAPASGVPERLGALRTQYRFLEKIYKYHSSVEDEVVYPALSAKVRNVTSAYSVEHDAEERLFEQLMSLLDAALIENGRQQAATVRRLVCKVEEIHLTLRKHLAKEEDQLFPLLLQHFSVGEQAELVAQFLCCIPLAAIEAVLSWLMPVVPPEEQDQLLAEVSRVVPDQLLQQMLVGWLRPHSRAAQPQQAAAAGGGGGSCKKAGLREAGLAPERPPLKEIAHLHTAIRGAMQAFAGEARALQAAQDLGATQAQLGALVERHRFLRSVCAYHQASEDEVLFPAVRHLPEPQQALASCRACEAQHSEELGAWEQLGRLLNDVRACARRGATEAQALMAQLAEAAEAACEHLSEHMRFEELQILPVLEQQLGASEQRTMVWSTLRAMPLRLLERVLPWLAGKLSEEQAADMLANMRLAAPGEAALVQLLTRWAERGRRPAGAATAAADAAAEPQGSDDPSRYSNRTCGVAGVRRKRSPEMDDPDEVVSPAAGGAAVAAAAGAAAGVKRRRRSPEGPGTAAAARAGGGQPASPRVNPIDHIFQFHKALKRELNFMEAEALRFAAALDSIPEGDTRAPASLTAQLEGRFRFLWGIYRAHSEAEDEIVFPALEAKEKLSNVSHAYTLDHQHENALFAEVEQVFDKIRGSADVRELRGLAGHLQRATAAMRAMLHQHVAAEEQELWPLFAEHFSVEEQEDIVGMIIGRTGAEVMQAMLPWVAVSFTQEEQRAMMDSFRNASRNTMFSEWLGAATAGSARRSKAPGTAAAEEQQQQQQQQQQQAQQQQRKQELPLADLAQYLGAGAVVSEAGGNDSAEASGAAAAAAPAPKGLQQPPSGAMPSADADQLSSPSAGAFKPGWQDIFRMNQKQLESAVRRMQSDATLEPERKAYLTQNIMAARYIVAQQQQQAAAAGGGQGPAAQAGAAGGAPQRTFHDAAAGVLGCPHYRRKCQIVAGCCGKVYSCRHCHDEAEDHRLERANVTRMVCMLCSLEQPVAAECAGCGERMGRYFCAICRLWDDASHGSSGSAPAGGGGGGGGGGSIYHCPFCNLCRRGQGLGVDACHCMHCNTCMHLSEFKQHTCRDLSTCPICTEYLFDSSQPYRELVCGHFMHSHCFAKYTRYDYACPVCCKSLGDMRVYFRMVDSLVARDRTSLPPAYRDRMQEVLCNDCGKRGRAEFHFVYHKCPHCASYNTKLV